MKTFFTVVGKVILLALIITIISIILFLPLLMVSMDITGGTVTINGKWTGEIAQYLQFAAFILGTWLMFFLFERKKGWKLGWRQPSAGRQYAKGMLLGLAAITLTAAVIAAAGGVAVKEVTLNGAIASDMLKGLILFVFVSLNEELLTRGYIQGLVRHSYGPKTAILAAALLFALMHGINPGVWDSPLPILNLVLAGVLLGLCREVSGGLWLPMGVHLTWNFFQGSVYGFSISGEEVRAPFLLSMSGADWLSGGTFGAEGSIMATLVLAGSCTWVYRKRHILTPKKKPAVQEDIRTSA